MSDDKRSLVFWGVRGTTPTPAQSRLKYGGNTICLGAQLGEHEFLLLDCGSGARELGHLIETTAGGAPTRIHLLMSHYHFDHIEGLPLFKPLYDPNATLEVRGAAPEGLSLRETLQRFIAPPYFPVRLEGAPAKVICTELTGEPFDIGDIRVSTLPLNHPDGCLAFRLESRGRRVIFATDHEHGVPEVDAALVEFARGADHLIYDATYLPTEYERLRKGWGHSTWYEAIRIAREAEVKQLILFHHHPDHTDDELDRVLAVARNEFPATEIAREGMQLPL